MKILIVCESSGTVREAFRALGHDAWSVDLLPADDGSPFHIQGDARDVSGEWDMMGFHPPCTYLSVSGMHWTRRGLRDPKLTEDALDLVRWCMSHKCPWYLENPVSIISTQIRRPDQTIQPYEFGEDASKRTCLWLNRLPKLVPTLRIPGRMVHGVERWSNQTDGGQNKLPPHKDRWKNRSKTYKGIATAMAQQWSESVLFSPQAANHVPTAESLFAWSAMNTTPNVNAQGHATRKNLDTNSGNAMESSTGFVHCPPGDLSILMRALAGR